MTFAEVAKLARVTKRHKEGWLIFGYSWESTEYNAHARKAWGGKAYVRGTGPFFCIFAGDSCAPYGASIDDLMADDWELVE